MPKKFAEIFDPQHSPYIRVFSFYKLCPFVGALSSLLSCQQHVQVLFCLKNLSVSRQRMWPSDCYARTDPGCKGENWSSSEGSGLAPGQDTSRWDARSGDIALSAPVAAQRNSDPDPKAGDNMLLQDRNIHFESYRQMSAGKVSLWGSQSRENHIPPKELFWPQSSWRLLEIKYNLTKIKKKGITNNMERSIMRWWADRENMKQIRLKNHSNRLTAPEEVLTVKCLIIFKIEKLLKVVDTLQLLAQSYKNDALILKVRIFGFPSQL